jgi:hypothetical protein
LRGTLQTNGEEVIFGRKKINNGELHDMYSSSDIFKDIKFEGMSAGM